MANTEVKAQLGGTWEAAQQRLARDLEAHLPASACPEASAWLNMELVRVGKPEGEELTRRLVGVSAACAFLPENRQKTKQLLKVAKDRVPDQQARAVVLGRMAEATIERSLGRVLYDEHLKAMEALKPNQRDEVRRQLARAGAARLLCRALLDDVLPWQDDSQKRFQKWSKAVLENQPRLVDCLCGRVVELLDREDLASEALSIARQLMAKPPVSTANAAGILRLYNKVLLTLPLRPLTDRWGKIFSMLPEGLDAAAKDRLRMLKFMQEVRALAGQPDWSLAKFPHDRAAWRELHRLPAHEQWQAVAWCVDRLRNVGIEGPGDARVFVEKLGAAQYASLHQMARAVDRLSEDRDPVTQVLVATAFARCGVEAPPLLDRWNALVAAIANTLDAPTRRLFEAHLRGRFWPRDAQLDKRLHELYVALGMEQPEPPPGADRPAKGQAGETEESQRPPHRRVLQLLRNLFWPTPPEEP